MPRMTNRQAQLRKLQEAGHKNGDAFMLYWYECVGEARRVHEEQKRPCGHRERIWNSRDGVVPFAARCPSCGSIMQHALWSGDEYAPDHKLRPFQKYWADMTEERARQIAKRVIASRAPIWVENAHNLPTEDELVKHYMSEFDGHSPMLCVYTGEN